ncbi:hypothetical protein TPHA_0A05450 [Tetrapisispora phaffii CBS 4417]|uniref:methionine--tRNA ligase n=1 Tax=Tetrapisispora phaffii (strain ATCC 24235 / CBS 4417 / NBRC 1672 / NRRL Y-8282 / UCD 70-5) TaxID=1071381 RepID=G8BNZ1_TETPH|nr:hypothetical protein TPHA_0A05450 [Tetrapisispora phaffii CBS 4417]CCE61619.1 hypothetical protein TPHA_0A05450 [Tetrapisispora phaffii CBS 4417]
MSAQLSFDFSKEHPQELLIANNLKLTIALEFKTKDLKLSVNEDLKTPSLSINDQFRLFNTDAILRYALNDFEGLNVEVSSIDFNASVTASKLISFANQYAKNYRKTTKLVDSIANADVKTKIQSAISKASSLVPRDLSHLKNTGNQNILAGVEVKKVPTDKKILPTDGERNILITSALPYVNNVPHLGNIVGSVLSADIYARYCKSRNYNTLFICGTDEYGTATETKALEEGVSPRELCDKYHKIHSDVYKWFQIGFDYFGRTTTDKQTKIAQDIFMKLNENGFLEEQSMKQLYCPEHNSYLADRYVEGECPKCHYNDARGDQCDKCGSLLDPFELINPRCKLDNASPIPKFSDHIFLSLDKLEGDISKWVEKASTEGKWSKNSKTITHSWLKDGLHPRCITRDLVWGTPVPLEKYKEKVLYVWFDATIGYVSITANYTDDWEKWWKNPENVDLYQFMGKDNVPFHTVIFPGSELGTNEPWTMLHHLNTTEYLQYEGGKFSKSRGVGVFGNNAEDSGIPPSVWRYYLASIRPETSDSHFSWDDFVTKNNSELLANLGNFVNRLIKFVNTKYNGVVPEFEVKNLPGYDNLNDDINKLMSSYVTEMEDAHERRGLEIAMALSARGNQFLQDNKLDNALFSQHPNKSDAVIGVGLNIVYAVASLIYPFMPETAETIYRILNAPALKICDSFNIAVLGGHHINQAEYLFKRIDEKSIETWREKYGGQK